MESSSEHHIIRSFLDLPSEILPEILSRLPVKAILRCKCVSRFLNHLISNPTFSSIHRSESRYLTTISYKRYPDPLNLIEFDKTVGVVSQTTLPAPGCCSNNEEILDVDDEPNFGCELVGGCDGIVLLQKLGKGKYDLFVENPILGECIRLPESIRVCMNSYPTFGLGYCQVSKKYKVLRINIEYVNEDYPNQKTEIFTIGLDEKWRSVEDDNVPRYIFGDRFMRTSMMIALNSGLHWLVDPMELPSCTHEWGGKRYICAFDLKEEKARAISLGDTALCDCCDSDRILGVVLGKLCLCMRSSDQVNVWVMGEYGNASSWTKQFIFKTCALPDCVDMWVTSVLDEGVIVVSDFQRFVFYDLTRDKILMVSHFSEGDDDPMAFYPTFVSLRNIGDY